MFTPFHRKGHFVGRCCEPEEAIRDVCYTSQQPNPGGAGPGFPSTRWTQVHRASSAESADHRREALGHLFEAYWKPVYFLVRRHGHDPDAARDLTQSFFTAFLERNFLRYVDPARGRFRTFLRTALDHHLADEWDRSRAQKRGGACRHVALDELAADGLESAAATPPTFERSLERQWAMAVIGRALEALRAIYQARGRLGEYETLLPCLVETENDRPSYAVMAASLCISRSDVTNRLHRLRRLYREAIWSELRRATTSDGQAREDLQELFTAFDC